MNGHWTREPPKKEGWYKAIFIRKTGIDFAKVIFGGDKPGVWCRPSTGIAHWYDLDQFAWWWSEPEIMPPLPSDEGHKNEAEGINCPKCGAFFDVMEKKGRA